MIRRRRWAPSRLGRRGCWEARGNSFRGGRRGRRARRDRGLVGGGFGWWFVALEVVRARRRVGGLVVELEGRGRDPCLGS